MPPQAGLTLENLGFFCPILGQGDGPFDLDPPVDTSFLMEMWLAACRPIIVSHLSVGVGDITALQGMKMQSIHSQSSFQQSLTILALFLCTKNRKKIYLQRKKHLQRMKNHAL